MRWIVPLLLAFLLPPSIACSSVDTDGDGVTDYREQKDETDSLDALSFKSLSKGLVVYYPFDNGLLDESGFGIHLNQTSSYELVADLTSGSGQALRLPSATSVAASSSLNSGVGGNSPRTVSFWFYSDKPHPWPDGGVVRLAGNVVLIDNGRGVIDVDNNYRNVQTPPIPQLHQRVHHFVWTYDERLGNSKLYINGQRVETVFRTGFGEPNQTLSGARPDSTVALGGTTGFQGKIDDVRLYSRVLSAEDVTQLYLQERNNLDTDGDGLTDHYEMGFGRYQFVEGNFTWEQAKADAESRGGHLGTITSLQEHEFLRANFAGYAAGSLRPWLGGSDAAQEGTWVWITGEVWNYTRWNAGEPNNAPNTQHYLWSGIGTSADQLWDDLSNDTLHPLAANSYLLEFGYPTDPLKADTDGDGYDDKIESVLGSDPNDKNSFPADAAATLAAGTTTIEIVQGTYTWNQAKVDAVSRGGRLAIFPTGTVFDRVASAIRNTFSGYFWLGGSDAEQEGVWRWIDGTPITYGRWQSGEPNNQSGVEHALHVVVGNTIWNDAPPDGAGGWSHAYALEKRPLALLDLPFAQQGASWAIDYAVAHDGFSSAKTQTTDNQSTYRQYTVTGPAVVDFWWKVSSEKNFDTFSYSLNGVNQETISGEVDWTYRTMTLPAGAHTIRWTYAKDESGAIGQDAGMSLRFILLRPPCASATAQLCLIAGTL